MRAAGYTRLFESLLMHPNIKVMLNTDYRDIVHLIPWSLMIYTGPVPHLVDATLDLLVDGEIGIVHLTNRIDDGRGAISWASFARAAAAAAGLDPAGAHAVAASALGQQARRPVNAALASERLWPLPPLSRAIDDYVRDAGVSVDNASTGRIADRDTGATFATAPTHMMR